MTVRGILCDLDGVVYRGEVACPGAIVALLAAQAAGVRVLFMTNNASRTPEEVAAQITGLGLPTDPSQVFTASQVAARVLADRRASGELVLGKTQVVLALGGEGVGAALTDVGLPWRSPTQLRTGVAAGSGETVGVVVQGYGQDVGVRDLSEAAYALAAGASWIATNDDATLPTPRGLAVGNGSLVAAVARATDKAPEVVGKPYSPAYEQAIAALGLPIQDCLMIGDRLDTDIAGAAAIGLTSALVLTGVSTREEAQAQPEQTRPDHIAATIGDLDFLWSQP